MQFDPKSYCILSSGAFSKISGDTPFEELKPGILEDEIPSEDQQQEPDGDLLVNYFEAAPFDQLKSKGERDLEMAKTWSEKIKNFRKYIQKPFPKHSHMAT